MGMTARPLVRIADRHDEYGEFVGRAVADGRVCPAEAAELARRHGEIAGLLSVQDTFDAAGDCLRRNGLGSDETRRWLRRAVAAEALRASGFAVIEGEGGGGDDPAGPAAVAA